MAKSPPSSGSSESVGALELRGQMSFHTQKSEKKKETVDSMVVYRLVFYRCFVSQISQVVIYI